jgi:uncharacterized protein YcbK (DUF882 family)
MRALLKLIIVNAIFVCGVCAAQMSHADIITRPAWSYKNGQEPTTPVQIPLPMPRPALIMNPPLPPARPHVMEQGHQNPPSQPLKKTALVHQAPSQPSFAPRTNFYVRPVDYADLNARFGAPHPRPVSNPTRLESRSLIQYASTAADQEEKMLAGEDYRIMHIPSIRRGYQLNKNNHLHFSLMGAQPSWYAYNDRVITSCFPPLLRSALKQLAQYFHRDVLVTSGYRDHGLAHSRHRTCDAADIMIDGVTPIHVAHVAAHIAGVNGIGTYRHVRIVHIDVRDYKSAWRY